MKTFLRLATDDEPFEILEDAGTLALQIVNTEGSLLVVHVEGGDPIYFDRSIYCFHYPKPESQVRVDPDAPRLKPVT